MHREALNWNAHSQEALIRSHCLSLHGKRSQSRTCQKRTHAPINNFGHIITGSRLLHVSCGGDSVRVCFKEKQANTYSISVADESFGGIHYVFVLCMLCCV